MPFANRMAVAGLSKPRPPRAPRTRMEAIVWKRGGSLLADAIESQRSGAASSCDRRDRDPAGRNERFQPDSGLDAKVDASADAGADAVDANTE